MLRRRKQERRHALRKAGNRAVRNRNRNQTNPFDSLQYDECTQQTNNKTEIIPQFRFHVD